MVHRSVARSVPTHYVRLDLDSPPAMRAGQLVKIPEIGLLEIMNALEVCERASARGELMLR